MGYLKEFRNQIANHDYPSFLKIWEEYCYGDEVDSVELKAILNAVKSSPFAESFGRHVEKILPLWENLPESSQKDELFKLIIDIQTTNQESLGLQVMDHLRKKFGHQKNFAEKLRLIGFRGKDKFQGAISSFELLNHLEKGNFVFHNGGWGVGEIVDVSFVREQVTIEFDYVPGKKDLSFNNAFKTLIPIPKNHFLALRFGNPDLLETQARQQPVEVIRILLRDLGPKSAAEIKDEICDLVIPEKDWAKWWQSARGKIKKDTRIETPEDLKEQFCLRDTEVSHEERLRKALENKPDSETLIQIVHSFIKDFPETLKNEEFRLTLYGKLKEMLSFVEISDSQELQFRFFLEDLGETDKGRSPEEMIKEYPNLCELIQGIRIQAFKKRSLQQVRVLRGDWTELFLTLLFLVDQSPLRDYIFGELLASSAKSATIVKLEELLASPGKHPETFLWYFQKALAQPSLPFSDKEGKNRLFESFLILLSILESKPEERDLVKKIHGMLSNHRYAIVREIMQGANIATCKEFLLLATKCHTIDDHDIKILHSLAEVVHPSLGKLRKLAENADKEEQVLWTTGEGYQKLQHRIQQIATVETVENAREIEVARSHGDLRENAEFKAALEKRARLQGELKFLSEQLNKARIITKEDISTDEVGIGTVVDCKTKDGETVTYTLLGPFDADTDKNILSLQSKLAQTMRGLTIGDKFPFQGDEYLIVAIRSYL